MASVLAVTAFLLFSIDSWITVLKIWLGYLTEHKVFREQINAESLYLLLYLFSWIFFQVTDKRKGK